MLRRCVLVKRRCVRRWRIGLWLSRPSPRRSNVDRPMRRRCGKIRKCRVTPVTRRRPMTPVLVTVVLFIRKFPWRTVRKLIRCPLTCRVTMLLVVGLCCILPIRFRFRNRRRLLKVLSTKCRCSPLVVKVLNMARVGRLFTCRVWRSLLNRLFAADDKTVVVLTMKCKLV